MAITKMRFRPLWPSRRAWRGAYLGLIAVRALSALMRPVPKSRSRSLAATTTVSNAVALERVQLTAIVFCTRKGQVCKNLEEMPMPIYISRGRFTSDAIKGMLAKPENREDAVAKLFKSVGGKLIGWYLTFGHHDWMAIGEFPDEKAAASAILAAAAGGSLSDIETTVAMTAKDAAATFGSAGKAAKEFRSAGRKR